MSRLSGMPHPPLSPDVSVPSVPTPSGPQASHRRDRRDQNLSGAGAAGLRPHQGHRAWQLRQGAPGAAQEERAGVRHEGGEEGAGARRRGGLPRTPRSALLVGVRGTRRRASRSEVHGAVVPHTCPVLGRRLLSPGPGHSHPPEGALVPISLTPHHRPRPPRLCFLCWRVCPSLSLSLSLSLSHTHTHTHTHTRSHAVWPRVSCSSLSIVFKVPPRGSLGRASPRSRPSDAGIVDGRLRRAVCCEQSCREHTCTGVYLSESLFSVLWGLQAEVEPPGGPAAPPLTPRSCQTAFIPQQPHPLCPRQPQAGVPVPRCPVQFLLFSGFGLALPW